MKGSAPVQLAGAVTLAGHTHQSVRVSLAAICTRWPILAKSIAPYGRVDLLSIEELLSLELDRRGAGLLFQVLTERELIASFAAKQITGRGFTLRCIKKRRPVRHEPFSQPCSRIQPYA